MRGEDPTSSVDRFHSAGSPPHARGRLMFDNFYNTLDRDHPRMRGEDLGNAVELSNPHGSPPHARGRRRTARGTTISSRITPACAGKTAKEPGFAAIMRDHPRMRGEDKTFEQIGPAQKGSPPHARGRLGCCVPQSARSRITPACAGKTLRTICNPCTHRGSPPHARGRRLTMVLANVNDGITPACAGKTPKQHAPSNLSWDHPRMRGEDGERILTSQASTGSPPHARGRPSGRRRARALHGITPACAGKTTSPANAMKVISDHPRMRGEDFWEVLSQKCGLGSPPHARGRHFQKVGQFPRRRITPACAGKTLPYTVVV